MDIFLWVFLLLAALSVVKGKIELTPVEKKRGFFALQVYFLSIKVYKAVFYVRFRHYIRPEIIKVKRHGFKKIYSFTLRKRKRKVSVLRLLRPRDIRRLDVCITAGTGDAALTAILCGTLASAVHGMYQVLGLKNATRQISPDFEKAVLNVSVFGIVRISIADSIVRFLKEKRRKYASDRKYFEHNHV